MKNEKEFKKRISEIAARIAEAGSNPSFDDQVEDLLPTLSILFNKVRNEDQLADIISAMVKHMPVGKNKSAVSTGLRIAGKVVNTDPATSPDNPNAMDDGVPLPDDLKEEYDSAKIDLPDSIKARINSAIANQKDMALFILDIMGEIIDNEPGMDNIESKAGWNSVSAQLKRLAGQSTSNSGNVNKDGEVPDVSPDKMNALQETYNRIKRK